MVRNSIDNEMPIGRHRVHTHAMMDQAFFAKMQSLVHERFDRRKFFIVKRTIYRRWIGDRLASRVPADLHS